MIFEIDNIELDFDGKHILNGIYLKSETGKITGIIGANGTGKSSLLNIIFGNLKPIHKLIRINRKAYLKPLFTSGLVKYLPQHSMIPPYLQIVKAFLLYKVDWEEFLSHFPDFGAYYKCRPRELSGGHQRILETYLTIKSPSQLVLLDEPFTHLSPVNIDRFKIFLAEEKKKKAIIITDHMYHHILDAADELYLLKNCCSKYIRSPKELEDYKYLNPNTL